MRYNMKKIFTFGVVLLLTGCADLSFQKKEVPVEPVETTTITMPDMQNIYMTKAYETAATRITNKMLDDTPDLYEVQPRPKIYIRQIRKEATGLPDGFYTAQQVIKDIISGSGTYTVVNKADEADYILATSINQFNVDNLPGIIIKQSINDIYDQQLRGWNIVIKQMTEYKSWW